jgi:hypothetical protein
MIRYRPRISSIIIAPALLLAAVTGAQAQVVAEFSQLRDASPGKFFDATKTTPSSANANQLNIGFNTGTDPLTFVSNEFRATTQAFGNRLADDTISFVVTAPAGFYVASLTYSQQGTASTARTAQQNGDSQWTVAGFPAVIAEYAGNPTVTGVVDLTPLQPASVPVSITVSLFAGPTGDIALTSASVVADIKPLGIPRDGTIGGGIPSGAPNPGGVVNDPNAAPPPAANDDNRGRGRDEDEARRGNQGNGRGQGGRESGRGSGR